MADDNGNTYFVWISNLQNAGPDNNINNPVIIKKMNEQNNFVSTNYLPLKKALNYGFFYEDKIRLLTTIPYSDSAIKLAVFNTVTEEMPDVLFYEPNGVPFRKFLF
jgi:hypothetical protein